MNTFKQLLLISMIGASLSGNLRAAASMPMLPSATSAAGAGAPIPTTLLAQPLLLQYSPESPNIHEEKGDSDSLASTPGEAKRTVATSSSSSSIVIPLSNNIIGVFRFPPRPQTCRLMLMATPLIQHLLSFLNIQEIFRSRLICTGSYSAATGASFLNCMNTSIISQIKTNQNLLLDATVKHNDNMVNLLLFVAAQIEDQSCLQKMLKWGDLFEIKACRTFTRWEPKNRFELQNAFGYALGAGNQASFNLLFDARSQLDMNPLQMVVSQLHGVINGNNFPHFKCIINNIQSNPTLLKKALTAVNKSGNNALMMASAANRIKMVTIIINAAETDPDLLNQILTAATILGHTALVLAEMNGHSAILKILQEALPAPASSASSSSSSSSFSSTRASTTQHSTCSIQ